jgi:4-alpha-glucanotransferase
MIIEQRSSGILLHITSLPSEYGIGDLGPEAYRMADLMKEAGQRYWQILPLNPTEIGMGNSPYSSRSAFAGNPLLLSPELLLEDGLVEKKDLKKAPSFKKERVEFDKVAEYKHYIWDVAYTNFKEGKAKELDHLFDQFQDEHAAWLKEYSRFAVFKAHFGNRSWVEWDEPIKQRDEKAMDLLASELADRIQYEAFLQFLFYRQWEALRKYCDERDIHFFGDMPFYVSHDSADVWSNPQYFKLDKNGQPTAVSGVPPDFFSETGQLWGTPVFDWKELEKHGYDWWLRRIDHNLRQFAVLRLDHFRAMSAYWEVPAGEKTAKNGEWKKSPGAAILSRVKEKYDPMPIVAEDLGEIDDPVRELMKEFDLPGMRLLLFAFIDDIAFESSFLPHNHIQNCIVYTGTHDNEPVRAWFENATKKEKAQLSQYTNDDINKKNVHDTMCRLALQSVAQLTVLPMQDVLGLGAEATMNKPGTGEGNWEWRLKPGQFGEKEARDWRQQVEMFGRHGEAIGPEEKK